MILISIFLNVSDVEDLSICFFVICIFSSVKYLFMFFACFLAKLFVLLILSFKNSLHILRINPLSDVGFANVFSQSIICFYILGFFTEQSFNFDSFNLSIFPFMDHTFGVKCKTFCPTYFLLCFS